MSSAFDVASGPVDRRLAKQWLGALRIIGLHSRPLWYDEAFSLLYAALDPGDILAGTVTPVEGAGAADVHPLLYYFVLHGWMQLVGESPFAARFLSLLVGLITVALLTRLGRRCFGPRIGAAVGFMGAVNPFHVAYSQEARMYALLGLGAVLAAWGLSRATDERRLRWWALYAGGAALTIYAHNLGAVILAALHLPVVLSSTVRRDLACLALADLLALLLFGPWLLVEADVVRGRTLTSYPSLQTDIRNAGGTWVDREVQVDQGLVTSRRPDDLPAFTAKLVEEVAEGRHEAQARSEREGL